MQIHVILTPQACDHCKDTDLTVEPDCPTCGQRKFNFPGDTALDDFCAWLFTVDNADCVVLAHNMRGYDGQFIMEYLHRQGVLPEIVTKGGFFELQIQN
jgi:hypothetical protein